MLTVSGDYAQLLECKIIALDTEKWPLAEQVIKKLNLPPKRFFCLPSCSTDYLAQVSCMLAGAPCLHVNRALISAYHDVIRLVHVQCTVTERDLNFHFAASRSARWRKMREASTIFKCRKRIGFELPYFRLLVFWLSCIHISIVHRVLKRG